MSNTASTKTVATTPAVAVVTTAARRCRCTSRTTRPVNLVEDLSATPPALQCGRVLFSDFHVEDADENRQDLPCPLRRGLHQRTRLRTGGKCVGGYCLNPMTAQEKLLEYMIFDLGSCVPPPDHLQARRPAALRAKTAATRRTAAAGWSPAAIARTVKSCGVRHPARAEQVRQGHDLLHSAHLRRAGVGVRPGC